MRWDGDAVATSLRSEPVVPARGLEGPRRRQAQSSFVDLLFAGDRNRWKG
jgi:hypothetical protein